MELVRSNRQDGGRKPPGSGPVDVERRLFDLSLGKIRLLDTTLDKAGLPELAMLLRELVMGWRAYPSRSRFSREDLRDFSKKLGQIRDGLGASGCPGGAGLAFDIMREIKSWIGARK
jgi:hypothetical protein